MSQKKIDPQLMKAGEEAFWEQLEKLEKIADERYIVVDKRTGDVIVHNARLRKEKNTAEV